MDRRSWPWRKKSSEKVLGLGDSVDLSPAHYTRHFNDHHMGMVLDEETVSWQQCEEKFQQLNERLSVALLDASAKDELIKQHAKVAEEAVSGWEKAETEAFTLKQELDTAIQKKLALEDRASHLNGALKECTQQLRRVREEQEKKIHDATIKNKREWERLQSELEEKLADMEQKYLNRDAENKAITKLLQERSMTISEVGEARSRAEADLNVLQIRLESMEKEYNGLKYEYSVSKKELEMRNEEKIFSKRSSEAANRQHLEDAKKIAKLEAECQHLRGLVRRKFPGPNALASLKLDVESSREKHDNRKKTGKGVANVRDRGRDLVTNMPHEQPPSATKDVDALLERLSAMEDELRMLKELLARRESELQHARLMCARTASKLSSVEEQLEQLEFLSHDKGIHKTAGMSALDKHVEAARSFTISCEPSLASVSEDGNDECSDVWASALITELAHFKIEKPTSLQEPVVYTPKTQIDIMEMKHPISLESDQAVRSLEQNLVRKREELHAAHQLCHQVNHKLGLAEQELATVQSQNAATQLSLQNMQSQLDLIFQAQADGENVDIVLDQVRETLGIPQLGNLGDAAKSRCLERDAPPCITRKSSYGQTAFLVNSEVGADSSVSDTIEFDESKKQATEVVLHDDNSSIVDMVPLPEIMKMEEELRKVQGEKVALETHMRMEFQRFEGLENEVVQLRGDKLELEHLLEVVKEELDRLKAKLHQAEQVEFNLWNDLTSGKSSRQRMEEELLTLNASKAKLEAQLELSVLEQNQLWDSKGYLERELVDKNEKLAELELKCEELNEKLSMKPESICSKCSMDNAGGEQASKEIAAKLAKCQQTISFLGKQLQGFTSPKEHLNIPQDSPRSMEGDASSRYSNYIFSNSLSELHPGKASRTVSPLEVGSETALKKSRRRVKREPEWDPYRDSNASDALDSELVSLSKSARPLLELFGDKTPAHEHYIQAVEQLTSSSDEEFIVPKSVEPTSHTEATMLAAKLPANRKKKSLGLVRGMDLSRSMDDTSSEKSNGTFTRLFSRSKATPQKKGTALLELKTLQ